MKKSYDILITIIAALLFAFFTLYGAFSHQKKEILLKDSVKTSVINRYNQSTSKTIMSFNGPWYIVDSVTISTKSNGEGLVVVLDKEIRARIIRGGILRPDKNKKIVFYSLADSAHFSSGFTIFGGLLSYDYYIQ